MLRLRIYGMTTAGLLLLAAATAFYFYLADRYHAIANTPLLPSKPLNTFPSTIGSWQSKDIPIAETVLKAAGNDDHLSRFYYQPEMQIGASVYVGYTAEPRRMLGHRPQVCYVNNGWIHDFTHPENIRTASNTNLPCLIFRFYKPGGVEQVFVLNYYIVNGHITTDHKAFDGLSWRCPKQIDGRIQYVAQIQISAPEEQTVRLLAAEIADVIFDYMP